MMSGTRRRVINRTPVRPVINGECVRLFKRGLALVGKGREDSSEFRRVNRELRIRLGLRPWHESVLCVTIDDPPPDDPYEYAQWKKVIDLRKALIVAT